MAAENTLLSDQQFIQRMKVFNAEAPATGFVATGNTGGTAPNGGSFLQDATAAVTGAFGLAQQGIDLVSESIAVSIQDFDEHWTSFAEVANAVSDDILDLIDGGDYSGQILKLRIPDGVTEFVINNANRVGNDTGNILMSGVENLRVAGGEVVEFIYDIFTTPQAGAQSRLKAGTLSGVWRLASGSAGPTAPPAAIILGLSTDQLVDGVILWDENFIFGDATKVIDEGGGVIQLLDDTYSLDTTIAIEGDVTGAGSEFTIEWQSSADGTTGWTTIPNPQARLGVLNTGRAGFTTQPHATAVVVVATAVPLFVRCVLTTISGIGLIAILDLATGGTIESVGSGGGGSGGGGTGLTNPLEENLNLNGYNFLMDIDGDTFWKNERDGLADDWTQLLVGGAIGLNISNRAGNQWVRSGFNLEPNGSQTLGSLNQRWDEVYVDNFMDFDANTPANPAAGEGRLFWNSTTNSFHQLDENGTNTDLVGSASDVSQWATFPAVQDVVPNGTSINLGSITADRQWGGLFMDPSTSIFWETTLGLFTDTRIQGTTGGFNLFAPLNGSFSFNIDANEEFKVDAAQISINTPLLDFNDGNATIIGLHNLNFFDNGSITNVSTIPGIGGPHLIYDIAGTVPGHLFRVDGQEYLRIANDGDRTVDFRPDDSGGDDPTGIKNVRAITFLETGTPSITPGLANITTNTLGEMFTNVAAGGEYNIRYGNDQRLSLTENNVSIINGLGGAFNIINTVGNSLSINKSSTLPADIACDDDLQFTNNAQGLIVDYFGDFNGSNLVPAQIFFSGKNSVNAKATYAKIKSRIGDPTSGAQHGDLEFYAYRFGVEEEQITLKGKDPIRGAAVIYMRSNVEFLSQAANANFLFLNGALIGRDTRTTNPGTTFGSDSIEWLQDESGVVSLKIRFANGVTKTIADNT